MNASVDSELSPVLGACVAAGCSNFLARFSLCLQSGAEVIPLPVGLIQQLYLFLFTSPSFSLSLSTPFSPIPLLRVHHQRYTSTLAYTHALTFIHRRTHQHTYTPVAVQDEELSMNLLMKGQSCAGDVWE